MAFPTNVQLKSAVREEPSLCSSANTLGASVLIGLAPLAFCDYHGPHFHPSREFTCFRTPYFCAARVSCAITFSGRAFASAEVNSTAPSRLRCIPSSWYNFGESVDGSLGTETSTP